MRRTTWFVFIGMTPLIAWAQPVFQSAPAEGQIRGAVIAPGGAVAYLAVYNHAEVRKVSLATGAVLAAAPVGKGPAAVALSTDGAVLASANRLAGTATLIRADSMTPIAEVPCGEGAGAVTALPEGGFAVANAFADSVTLIDPRRPDAPVTVTSVGGVPRAIAASADYLAVAVREPASVLFYRAGEQTPTSKILLPGAPAALCALEGNRFVVLAGGELAILDAEKARRVHTRASGVTHIAWTGAALAALEGSALTLLDETLKETERWVLPAAARVVAGRGGAYVVADPQAEVWSFRTEAVALAPVVTAAPLLPSEAPAAPSPEPLPSAEPISPAEERKEQRPEPSEVEAQPVEIEAEAAGAQEAPAPETKEMTPTPAPPVAPIAETPAPPESVAPELPVAAAPGDDDIKPSGAKLRRVPLGAVETYAPRPGSRRPHPYPTLGPGELTVEEGILAQPDFMGGAGGFQAVDWTKPYENIRADRTELGLDGRSINAIGAVHWQVENTSITGDRFEIHDTDESLEIEGVGAVRIVQGEATLDADRLYYRAKQEEEGAAAESPFAAALRGDAQQAAKRRLAKGYIEAENIHIDEPERELIARQLNYDFASQTGAASDVRGRVGIFYYHAAELRILGPADAEGEDVWVTTCDHDPPHYRVRMSSASIKEGSVVTGSDANLKVGNLSTPFFWPKWRLTPRGQAPISVDFDSGRQAGIGYFVNVGQRFAVNENIEAGYRLYPTSEEGVGFGGDVYWDYMDTPVSPLFRSRGEFHGLYTTKDRGYYHFYHRQELDENTVLLLQTEQWSDRDFYKDFYYETYRNRNEPRTFANLTYTEPTYIASATVRKRTMSSVADTERLPEVAYHLLDRRIAPNVYFSLDSVAGYNRREPSDIDAGRVANVARLTYDLDFGEAASLTPYLELEASYYSDTPEDSDAETRFSTLAGITAQTRLHKAYPGRFGFSGFKHVIVPSITYSYRPESTLDVEDTPRFDAYDNVYGRSRIESKLDNILFGRDAKTKEVWPVLRLTLYQGSDFQNEFRKSDDYEVELDLRPRPWWGVQAAGERHSIENDTDLDRPFGLETAALQVIEDVFKRPPNSEVAFRYNAQYADYNRALAYAYYDDRSLGGRFNGRVGFAYTETLGEVFNREALYGAGYQIGENWGVAFEHRYDFARNDLSRQQYELWRNLHCWEAGIVFTDRETGWDIGFTLNLVAFPGTKVKF